ncbi:autotransporter domain-containing protein [uncultured Duodenibacillus sp.]|uniref:autotransporter domain-containing protein n=1 Tax=uncultured Duodenibacillus sp. TaxID=1980699 RepID=UPI002803C8E8|nr:autotransporter domain-containing protein [uncultured Duodenibacillus sp.]
MNKSFKVVFSKARSALMVVNEATSSIQAKGTKTVIAAAAAAMIAGGAVAAQPETGAANIVYIGTGVTHSLVGTTTTSKGNQIWDTTTSAWIAAQENAELDQTSKVILDGTLNVGVKLGSAADTSATLAIASLNSTGVVNVTAGNAASSAAATAQITTTGNADLIGGQLNFLANPNATTKAAATSADGRTQAKTYGALSLESTGDVTLGQAATTDQAASVLAVKVDKDISATIKGANVNVTNATFANEGALTIQATGQTNPKVTFASDYTQGTGNSGKLDVIGASEFTGNVKFDSVMVGAARTTADAANNVVSESVLLNGNVTVNGTAKKAASFATGKLNIKSGTFTVGGYATADLGEVAVSGESTILAVNASGAATASKMTVSKGTLTVNGDLTVNKAADTPAVAAATDPVYDLTIGTAGNTVAGKLTAGTVLIGATTASDLTVTGTMQADAVTLKGDAAAKLAVNVADSSATLGTLTFDKSGTVEVGASGTLVVTGDTTFTKDAGSLSVKAAGAKATLQNVTFAEGATGKIEVTNGDVIVNGTLTANAGSLTVNGADVAKATVNGKVVAAGSTKTGLVELTKGTLTLGSTADIGTGADVVTLTAGTLEATSALLTANLKTTLTADEQKKALNQALKFTKDQVAVTVSDDKLSTDQIVDLQKRITATAGANKAAFAVTAITDSTGKEYTELFLRNDKQTTPSFNISTLAGDVHLKNIDAKVNTNAKTDLATSLAVGATGDATGNEFANNLGVQSLIFATTAPTGTTAPVAVTVDGGKSLTLYGSLTDTAKELVQAYTYTDETTKKVQPTTIEVKNASSKLVLGDATAGAAQRYGNLNAAVTVTDGGFDVYNGVFTVKSLKVEANKVAQVLDSGNLTIKSLEGAGEVSVGGTGVLTVESLASGTTAQVAVAGSAGSETAPKAKVAKYFRLAEATSTTDAATMIGRVVRSGASQLVVGTTDDSVLTKFMADNQYTYDYVDHTADPFSDIKHVDSATLIATNVNADHAEMTGLTVFDMGSIVVEKDQLGNNKAIVRGGTVSGEIGLANVSGKSLTWDAKTGIGSLALFTGAHEENRLTVGDAMLDGKVVNGTAQVKVQNAEEVMPGFFLNKDMQRIYDEHLFDAASSDAQIAMLTQFSQAVNGMTSLGEIKAASQALEEGSNSAVLGGAYNAALDAGEQFNKALDRRMTVANGLNRAEGFTLWADVIGTSNQAKKLYGNSGYDLDLYGGVLGGDYTFAQYDATLGAALTVGTGSGGSKGTATSIDNDVDFVGFSVYGNKRCPIVNSKFDLGYMQTKSDISAANSMGNWSSDVKAKAFTFGFGVELPTTVGIVNVTPHAGIRYTRLDVEGRDGLFGTDDDKLNVFQAPLGVTFSGAFETSGWNLAPTFDLSVVPAFGDKDATTKYNGLTTEVITRVVDSSPVQATLGLSAQKDAFTFGINYTLGAGSDERQNHSFNANVRYTF